METLKVSFISELDEARHRAFLEHSRANKLKIELDALKKESKNDKETIQYYLKVIDELSTKLGKVVVWAKPRHPVVGGRESLFHIRLPLTPEEIFSRSEPFETPAPLRFESDSAKASVTALLESDDEIPIEALPHRMKPRKGDY